MSNLSENNSFIELFKKEFKGIEFVIETVTLGNAVAHALFVYLKNENEIIKNWTQITNNVALHYQKKLTNDFDKWNLYLFFLVEDPSKLSNEIKYSIENNTFSSRKIIESNATSLSELIDRHIHNILSIETTAEISKETTLSDNNFDSITFDYNEIIWDTLKDKTIKKINIIHEEQMKIYNQLLNKLRTDI